MAGIRIIHRSIEFKQNEVGEKINQKGKNETVIKTTTTTTTYTTTTTTRETTKKEITTRDTTIRETTTQETTIRETTTEEIRTATNGQTREEEVWGRFLELLRNNPGLIDRWL